MGDHEEDYSAGAAPTGTDSQNNLNLNLLGVCAPQVEYIWITRFKKQQLEKPQLEVTLQYLSFQLLPQNLCDSSCCVLFVQGHFLHVWEVPRTLSAFGI